jgi:transcription factor AP-1
MTLDFNSPGKTKQQKIQHLLGSPDLNMLKLASPELEKFIIQANGMVSRPKNGGYESLLKIFSSSFRFAL